MKTIKIQFTDIVKMRQLEGALNFVNVSPIVDDKEMTIEIEVDSVPKHLKIEVSHLSAKISFIQE